MHVCVNRISTSTIQNGFVSISLGSTHLTKSLLFTTSALNPPLSLSPPCHNHPTSLQSQQFLKLSYFSTSRFHYPTPALSHSRNSPLPHLPTPVPFPPSNLPRSVSPWPSPWPVHPLIRTLQISVVIHPACVSVKIIWVYCLRLIAQRSVLLTRLLISTYVASVWVVFFCSTSFHDIDLL